MPVFFVLGMEDHCDNSWHLSTTCNNHVDSCILRDSTKASLKYSVFSLYLTLYLNTLTLLNVEAVLFRTLPSLQLSSDLCNR